MRTLKEAFLDKYPKYGIILRMYEEANECTAEWSELSKLRLIRFTEYMGERVAPNSVRQYAAKMKAVLNLKSASNLNGNLNCSKELEHYAS